jgi:hypothetical protein
MFFAKKCDLFTTGREGLIKKIVCQGEPLRTKSRSTHSFWNMRFSKKQKQLYLSWHVEYQNTVMSTNKISRSRLGYKTQKFIEVLKTLVCVVDTNVDNLKYTVEYGDDWSRTVRDEMHSSSNYYIKRSLLHDMKRGFILRTPDAWITNLWNVCKVLKSLKNNEEVSKESVGQIKDCLEAYFADVFSKNVVKEHYAMEAVFIENSCDDDDVASDGHSCLSTPEKKTIERVTPAKSSAVRSLF